MALPVFSYSPTSRNHRVANYEVPGDEQPRIYCRDNFPSGNTMDALILSAYRQVYNEQQLIRSNRLPTLESQLRCGQITVRQFIRGLALAETFRDRNYNCNNNYRFSQMCVQRFLGRDVYEERETLGLSIILATQGLTGLIDYLLSSDEYLENFGDNTVPYQRRRILPQRTQGEVPFIRMPRYGADYRTQLEKIGYFQGQPGFAAYRWDWQKTAPSPALRQAWTGVAMTSLLLVGAGTAAVALGAWGIIPL
jgi:phycobilisome rod-core linker protein